MAAIVDRKKVSVPHLAKLWGVSSHKVIHFIRTGELKAINLAANQTNRPRYSIDVEDVAAFEASREIVPDGGESTTRKLRRRAAENVKEFF